MEVTLICSLKAIIDLPDNLKNEDEVREYLSWAYTTNEILKNADIEDFEIEEIENCPNDEEDIDKYVDEWIMEKE